MFIALYLNWLLKNYLLSLQCLKQMQITRWLSIKCTSPVSSLHGLSPICFLTAY